MADWLGRFRSRLVRALQRLAPARGLARRGLRRRDGGDCHRRRPVARARDLPGRGCPSVPAPLPGAGRHEVRVDRTTRPGGARRDHASGAVPATSTITLGYVGVQPSSYPINTIFLWTGGSHEGVLQVALAAGASRRLGDLRGGPAAPVRGPLSGRPVLVRTGRHRRPDHELRRADAGPGRRHRPRLRGHARLRGQAAAAAVATCRRCATCASSRHSTTRRSTSASTGSSPGSWVSPSARSVSRSPPPPRRAASWRRTTGPTRAPASPSRCRSRCRSRA